MTKPLETKSIPKKTKGHFYPDQSIIDLAWLISLVRRFPFASGHTWFSIKLVELAPFVWLTMAYIVFRDYLHTPMDVSTALRHVVIS